MPFLLRVKPQYKGYNGTAKRIEVGVMHIKAVPLDMNDLREKDQPQCNHLMSSNIEGLQVFVFDQFLRLHRQAVGAGLRNRYTSDL